MIAQVNEKGIPGRFQLGSTFLLQLQLSFNGKNVLVHVVWGAPWGKEDCFRDLEPPGRKVPESPLIHQLDIGRTLGALDEPRSKVSIVSSVGVADGIGASPWGLSPLVPLAVRVGISGDELIAGRLEGRGNVVKSGLQGGRDLRAEIGPRSVASRWRVVVQRCFDRLDKPIHMLFLRGGRDRQVVMEWKSRRIESGDRPLWVKIVNRLGELLEGVKIFQHGDAVIKVETRLAAFEGREFLLVMVVRLAKGDAWDLGVQCDQKLVKVNSDEIPGLCHFRSHVAGKVESLVTKLVQLSVDRIKLTTKRKHVSMLDQARERCGRCEHT